MEHIECPHGSTLGTLCLEYDMLQSGHSIVIIFIYNNKIKMLQLYYKTS